MKYNKFGFLLLIFLPVAVNASDTYVEADYMMFNIEGNPSWVSDTFVAEPSALGLRVGAKFTPNAAVEGLFVLGVVADPFESTILDVEVNNIIGMYGVGSFPVSSDFEVFGKVGITIVTYEDELGNEIDGTGLSFGFGGTMNAGLGAIVLEYLIFPETKYEESVWGAKFTTESYSLNVGYRMNFQKF